MERLPADSVLDGLVPAARGTLGLDLLILLRYRVACDGLLVYEATVDRFDRYRLQAARFWCDNAPVFERGDEEVLEALRP